MRFSIIIGILVVVIVGVAWFAFQDEPGTGGDIAFADAIDRTITGIEPGAGVMINTEEAMETYGLNEAGWTLSESSSAAMLSAVQDATENEEPIIATVWEPHAVFAIADVRQLDDPQNVYNDPEATRAFLEEFAPEWADEEVASDVVASIVYEGFADDAPAAYQFLQNFSIPADTQSEWIYDYNVEDMDPADIAEQYVTENQSQVEEWTPEDAELGKESLVLGIPPWPGVTVKSAVVQNILEDMGYEVEVREMDAGIVYTALSEQEIDINLAGWLPSTHGDYWDEHSGTLEIAGVNLTTTWLGLGVPEYVDESIQSIEDLAQ